MNDFYELLEKIRKRPSLYLNRYSIFSFQGFYNGFSVAKKMYDLPDTEQEQEFEDFLKWLQEDFFSHKINRSWAEILFIHQMKEKLLISYLNYLTNIWNKKVIQNLKLTTRRNKKIR